MRRFITTLLSVCFLFLSCQIEKLDESENALSAESESLHKKKKKKEKEAPSILNECTVIDADRSCNNQIAANFWWPVNPTDYDDYYFSSTQDHTLTFTEYSDGTANVKGSTLRGTCVVEIDVWFKDKKDWDAWSASGGTIKPEGCNIDALVKEDLHFYVIDSSRSTITASGDCGEGRVGTFGVEQRPDPNDPETPNLGVIIGPGGALWNTNADDHGLATWGWLTELPTVSNENCNDCDGKLNALTLQYNGNSEATIKVVQKKNSLIAFEGSVQPGGSFSFIGKDDKGTLGTEITIYVNGVENTKMHTSCSDPDVVPGYVSGDFLITAGSSRNGGDLCPSEIIPGERLWIFDFNFTIDCEVPCLPCKGKITELELQYDGPTADIVVKTKGKGKDKEGATIFEGNVESGHSFTLYGNDDKGTLGTEIKIYVNGVEKEKIHTSCSDPDVGPGYVAGDFTVIRGASREGGELCPSDNPGGGDDCEDCKGKVTILELEYNGDSSAEIKVETKKKKPKKGQDPMNPIVFEGTVAPGETFSFIGNDDKGTLGTEITIYVNGEVDQKIHTSCSVPIGPGAIFGDYTVISGASREGGELCPAEGPTGGEDCDCDGKIVEMSVIYDGPAGATVTLGKEDDGSDTLQTFNNVNPGDTLVGTIGNVGNWWYWSVNGSVEASIHTSCSDDILGNVDAHKSIFGNLGNYPDPEDGDNNGTFLVTSHTDEKGNTCSIEVANPNPGH